jgi:hypothetical protein
MEFVDYAPQTGISKPLPFDTAARHAYTLSEAIEAGFDPGAYEWRDVPEGTWDGHLDFRTWSSRKGAGALLCYFTDIRTGRRFRLAAARPWEGDAFRCTPKDRAIDFSRASVDDRVFRLRVRCDAKGHVAWIGAIARE